MRAPDADGGEDAPPADAPPADADTAPVAPATTGPADTEDAAAGLAPGTKAAAEVLKENGLAVTLNENAFFAGVEDAATGALAAPAAVSPVTPCPDTT